MENMVKRSLKQTVYAGLAALAAGVVIIIIANAAQPKSQPKITEPDSPVVKKESASQELVELAQDDSLHEGGTIQAVQENSITMEVFESNENGEERREIVTYPVAPDVVVFLTNQTGRVETDETGHSADVEEGDNIEVDYSEIQTGDGAVLLVQPRGEPQELFVTTVFLFPRE